MGDRTTVVLGAGPSGLGVAWELSELGIKNILVVEKQDRIGGLSGGYLVNGVELDYGPHRLSPEYPELIQKFKKILGEDLLQVPNDHAVFFQNRFYSYPPNWRQFLNLKTGYFGSRVLFSYLGQKMNRLETEGDFESKVIRRYGNEFYSKVLSPMCDKIWGNPKEFSPDFADIRFAVPTYRQVIKKILRSGTEFNDPYFYYPKQGFQALWDRLADHLKANGVQIKTGVSVHSVTSRENKISEINLGANGPKVAIERLVSTIPILDFAGLLQPSLDLDLTALKNPMRNRGILLLTFKILKPKVLPARVVIFPEKKFLFNRLTEQSQFSPYLNIGLDESLVQADIITDVGSNLWTLDENILVKRVQAQLQRLGLLDAEEIEWSHLKKVTTAYPLPLLERQKAQAEIEFELDRFENIALTGRFSTSDYNNSHTAIKKGIGAARYLLGILPRENWKSLSREIQKTAIRD